MSDIGLQRASTFSVKKETSVGIYAQPTNGSDFIPLRPGNELTFEPEQLENDELLNDIGAAKSATGKEIVSGSHSAYLKHSGVEGQEPEVGIFYESVMGGKKITTVEYDTVAGSTVNIIKVGVGEGINFIEGQSLLIKSGNGYEIRNIKSITGDNLELNFSLDVPPSTGVNLGKAITYVPAAQGHPTFSTTKYIGGGFAKEVSAGNTATEISLSMEANGYGEVEFSFEGTKYYFNPIAITASNKFLDVTDDGGTFSISLAERIYKTPIELAQAIQSALEVASAETYTVTFEKYGKFTIASGSTILSLLWSTGTNSANSIGTTLGFLVATNDTGATSYYSDNVQSYAAPYTPTYDNADAIIVKGAELFIGNQSDNLCVCAQSVSITISKEVEDVDCLCEESGILEKIPTSRSVEMSVTAVLKKHDVVLLDALLKNTGISAMLNAGPKSGGNWIGGKCFNAYLQSCTVSSYKTSGDSFIQAEITLKGYVSSTTKDIFLNFV